MSESANTAKPIMGIFDGSRQVATFEINRLTELGRRQAGEPPPFSRLSLESLDRIIVADLTDTQVSRRQVKFEPQAGGKITVWNESSKNSLHLLGNIRIAPGEQMSLELPITCEVGNKIVRLFANAKDEMELQSLQAATCAPGHSSISPKSIRNFVAAIRDSESNKIDESFLFEWLQASMDVFQSASASEDFLPKAARAAVDLVGLSSATVLLYQNGKWSVAATEVRENERNQESRGASNTMLKRVLEERRTFFFVPSHDAAVASLINVQSLVAAPFLDSNGNIVGVLYGERRYGADSQSPTPIRELDAKFVELLAYGVASGLARIEQERQLIAQRVRFEQFFTPELARVLEIRGDEMLAARDAEITVLFCDIKGFSRISASCGAALAVEWVCDVLSELSDCVAEFQGVLVDYSGDSLEGLWGAPMPIEDHATLACRAALRMRQTLPSINERWKHRLGEETDISIGLNTGPAQVGNIGSRRKFKYGALGTTVNLASRLQGATKYVGPSVLASRSTIARIDSSFPTRRVCTIRTVNIDEPVEIYELCESPTPDWQVFKLDYEKALDKFEQREFAEAEKSLTKILSDHPSDIPTRRLLERLANAQSQSDPFDSVWTLDGK